jgi:hypothetical protein
MTDGTITTILSLVVAVLATGVSAVVVWRTRERERRRATEHEAVALRDARLRAELRLLDVRAGELPTQIADLSRQSAHLVAGLASPDPGSDPAAALAEGALRRAHSGHHAELARRLERAGDARVIPFPFLATEEED